MGLGLGLGSGLGEAARIPSITRCRVERTASAASASRRCDGDRPSPLGVLVGGSLTMIGCPATMSTYRVRS